MLKDKFTFFGLRFVECFIPADAILSIFSPELNAQFSAAPKELEYSEIKSDSAKKPKIYKDKKVIKVDGLVINQAASFISNR